MNYTELEQKLGKQTQSDWHQASGGGWIHKDAKVENEANIRDNPIIWRCEEGLWQCEGL
jgi:hypothetical protein